MDFKFWLFIPCLISLEILHEISVFIKMRRNSQLAACEVKKTFITCKTGYLLPVGLRGISCLWGCVVYIAYGAVWYAC